MIDRLHLFLWRIKRCLFQQIKDYIEVSQFHQHFSPAFFHTKVLRAAFLYLHFMLTLFWRKNSSTKAALKMLVKLSHGLTFLFLALFLLQNWPLNKTIKSDYNKATNCLVNVFKVRSFKSKKHQVCKFNPFHTNMWRIKLTWKFPALALRLPLHSEFPREKYISFSLFQKWAEAQFIIKLLNQLQAKMQCTISLLWIAAKPYLQWFH